MALGRHGLGHVVARMNLQDHMPMVARIVSRGKLEVLPPDDETIARRLVLTMQELGPTFTKLGQILSTRPDIIPEPYLCEFRKLQDSVKPFSTSEAKAIIEKELGRAIPDVFSEFGDEPFASGSIAQVYHARLASGHPVVVKVRRPGIKSVVKADIELLYYFAHHAERNWPELNPVRLVEEFESSIRKELDFVAEASYTSKFHQLMSETPGITSPRVFWDCSTSQVLTVERMSGIRPDSIAELDRCGIDRPAVAKRLAEAFMRQYVELGFFHADPHPGNLFIDEQGNVAIVDFGNTAHLTDQMLSQLSTALIAVSKENIDILLEVYFEMGEAPPLDTHRFMPDFLEIYDKYYGMPLKRIDLGSLFNDFFRLARAHGLTMPRNLVMLSRSLVLVTGVCRTLDPEFNMSELIEPAARRVLAQKVSPKHAARKLGLQLWHTSKLMQNLPGHLKTILQKIEAGTMTVSFKHQGLEGLINELDRVSNRLSVSIILMGTVVGSSIALHSNFLSLWGIPVLGIAGYVIAAMLGLWLVWDILRSGRY